MIDTCTQVIALVLLLALSGCHAAAPPPKPAPPYSACLPRPVPLPPIATVEQLRTRHDRLDTLYTDCAARLRKNLEAIR